MKYLDFELMILGEGEGTYRARIVESPGGHANVQFKLPHNKLELEEFLMRMRNPRRSPSEIEAAKKFGGKLFETIFDAEMRGVLRTSMDEAERQQKGLRLRLRFADSAADLGGVPWEFLYYEALNRFPVLSTETPIVRYLEMPERIEPILAESPLNILVMISAPSDQVQLDVEKEWQVVNKALSPLADRGLITFTRIDDAQLSTLQGMLRQNNYHIFHFIGHGEFEKREGSGTLLLENSDGASRAVSGVELGTMLSDHRLMRLIVLNACEGGQAARDNQFAGAAQALIQAGIPAVIAQQFKVSDDAAIALAKEFYGALADGFPVDSALTEGRKAVYALGNNVEWGTPVMYLRAPDGRIFDLGKETEDMADDKDKKEEKDQSFNISVGGNMDGEFNVAGGDINKTEIGSVGGDYVAGDQNIGGDKVSGDKISVGDISGGTGIAIGRGSNVTVDQSQTTITPFEETRKKVEELDLPEDDKEDVNYALDKIEKEAAKEEEGGEVNEDRIDRYLSVIEDVAPDAVEVLINAITNPGAAVGSGLRVAIKAWRSARKA